MKKTLLRTAALLLAVLLCLLGTVSCGNRSGKTLLTLKKDGITVTLSVNMYELMLSRMKGSLCFYGYTANGVTAAYDAFWNYTDKFDGENLQTIDEYYRANILDNCRTYLAALYLFESEGLTLSATDEEEIEDRLFELLRTDGDGSKTKLNAVLAEYGVNYDILKEAYTVEAKVAALQEHLYGENASGVGYNVKDEYLEENYVHFRQVFLSTYRYVYETDENGDVIYYYTEGSNKDHVYYDVYNGEVQYHDDGTKITDENGDVMYFVKGSDGEKIAYDSTNGEPAYVMEDNGTDYKIEDLTEEELKELASKAEALYAELKNSTTEEFEAAIAEKSDDMGEAGEYDDGYYLQKNVDYSASGETYQYLADIVSALEEMENGEVTMVQSKFGYHIVMKYAHSEKAYENEANEAWFESFYDDLIEQLFLERCQSLFNDIQVDEEVLAEAPSMKEVGINYNY